MPSGSSSDSRATSGNGLPTTRSRTNPGEVDAEVRVRVPGADGEAQPRLGDAAYMGVEVARVELVVVPNRCLVCEAGGVAQEHPQRDLPLRVLLERAVDGESR